jgi:hypothetical protein
VLSLHTLLLVTWLLRCDILTALAYCQHARVAYTHDTSRYQLLDIAFVDRSKQLKYVVSICAQQRRHEAAMSLAP